MSDSLQTILGNLGLPATALTTGGAVWGLFHYLEKSDVINPQRKADLIAFLNSDKAPFEGHNAGSFVLMLFDGMFGNKPFSFRFMFASFISSLIAVTFFVALPLVLYVNKYFIFPRFETDGRQLAYYDFFAMFICFSLMSDYVSLMKGRQILRAMVVSTSWTKTFSLLAIDVVLSIFVARLFPIVPFALFKESNDIFSRIYFPTPNLVGREFADRHVDLATIFVAAFMLSTLLTSIWALTVSFSLTILRLLVSLKYLNRATRWMFNVERKPIASLGTMLALITTVMIAAFHWL